jgi:hypothetical protein
MAHHCAEAGMPDKAVGYRLKAGQQAVARGAMTEAVTQLKKGLNLLAGLPNGVERQQQELDLQMALSLAIHATEGYGSAAMEEIILRASSLAEELDKPECLVPLLYGKHWLHAGRAQFKLAQSIAEQMETIGAASNDKLALLLGHFLHASDKFVMSYFESAMQLINQSRGIVDPPHYNVCAAMMVDDPHVALLACEALTLTYMGHIERGRTQMGQALGVARELGRAYPLIYALIWAAWSEWVSSSAGEARLHAEEAVTLSNTRPGVARLGTDSQRLVIGCAGRGAGRPTHPHRRNLDLSLVWSCQQHDLGAHIARGGIRQGRSSIRGPGLPR